MVVSGQLYALAALPTWKEPLLPIKEEAGWALEPVWMFWEKTESCAPAGTRKPETKAVVTWMNVVIGQ